MGVIKKQSIQSTVVIYLGVVIGFLNSVLLLPVLFSPEQVGLIGFLTSLTAIFVIPASMGIPLITNKMFPHFRSENGNNGFFSLTSLSSLIGIVGGIIVFLLCQDLLISEKNLARNYTGFALIFCIVFASRVIFRNVDSYLRLEYKTVLGITLDGLVAKIIVFAGLISAWAFPNIRFEFVFIMYALALAFPGWVLMVYALTQNISFSWRSFSKHLGDRKNEMISVGIFGILGGLGTVIVLEVDRVMVSNMLGLDANGVYSVAFFFGLFISIPSRGLKRIATTIISDSLKNDDMENVQTVYRKSCVNQLLIAGYLFLGIWTCIDYVFEFLKPEYALGKYVVLFIGLAQLVDMATGVNGEILSVSKYYRYSTYFSVVLIALVITLNYLFIPLWNISGAALASFLSILITNGWRAWFLYRKMGLQPFTLKMLVNLFLIGVLVAAFEFTPSFGNPFIGILVTGSIITLIYWPIAYALNLSEDINETVRNIIKRVTKS